MGLQYHVLSLQGSRVIIKDGVERLEELEVVAVAKWFADKTIAHMNSQ